MLAVAVGGFLFIRSRSSGASASASSSYTQVVDVEVGDLSASLITTKFGVDKAKVWARHSSVVTTEKHYSRFVDGRASLVQKNLYPWLKFATK